MFENIIMSPVQNEPEGLPFFTIGDDMDNKEDNIGSQIPILALRNTVLFPGVVIPITVGRSKSKAAVKEAFDADRLIGVISQKELKVDEPSVKDLYEVGTVARIVKKIKMPDGSTTAILQGRSKFRLEGMVSDDPFFKGEIESLVMSEPKDSLQYDALLSTIRDKAKQIIELSPQIPSEAIVMLDNIKKQ